MGAITSVLGERRAAMASGIVQAIAGIGDSLMAPAIQRMIAWKGIVVAMPSLSVPLLLMIPVVFWLSGKEKAGSVRQEEAKSESLRELLRTDLKDPAFWSIL